MQTVEDCFPERNPAPHLSPAEAHPEGCVQFWALQDRRDMKMLEQEQQRANPAKRIKGVEPLSQEERRKELGMVSVEERR